MEPKSIFPQHLTVHAASGPSSKKLQRKLHDAIRKRNLENVRNILNSFESKCDVNCSTSCGKTFLQVAGELRDVSVRNEIIKALLNDGADLQIALLQAVRDGDAKTVETLLPFHKQQPHASVHTLYSLQSQGYITPLILAAWLQNFQIVKLLLERGFTISDPNNPQWSSSSNGMVNEKIGPAVYRLNRYRALASPVYIAASFLQNVENGPDPIHRACVLNKELRETAEQEYEFRKEYLELSNECKEFPVPLLNVCRSMEEIRCVMEMKTEDGVMRKMAGFNMLEFAISTRNEKVSFNLLPSINNKIRMIQR